MEEKKSDLVFEGFFSLFGFTENPVEKRAKSILKKTSAEKIKSDLNKINKDYRSTYNELRKEVLCLE